jgi:hypothetical protein
MGAAPVLEWWGSGADAGHYTTNLSGQSGINLLPVASVWVMTSSGHRGCQPVPRAPRPASWPPTWPWESWFWFLTASRDLRQAAPLADGRRAAAPQWSAPCCWRRSAGNEEKPRGLSARASRGTPNRASNSESQEASVASWDLNGERHLRPACRFAPIRGSNQGKGTQLFFCMQLFVCTSANEKSKSCVPFSSAQ